MYQFNTDNYTVVSHGNGWAYEITDCNGDTLWLQDDDAAQLQRESNDFENEIVINQYFENLFN